jgi:hypothetical protein
VEFVIVIGFPEVPSRVACFEQSTVRIKISRIFTKEQNTLKVVETTLDSLDIICKIF